MSKKDLQQLQIISDRMIEAGISKEEVEKLIGPLKGELQRRVCGLVWEHKTTSIPDMEGKIPSLIPVADKNIVQDIGGDNHVLIEGENLLALMAMQYTHIDENGKGMIDVIYIDPPYNTGSVSFAYNDKFEKSEWLSMMDIRLKLARNLLKDDGVIFISIDDTYLYHLKLLVDDVFGADNMVVNITVNRPSEIATSISVQKTEYCMVYAKSKVTFTKREKETTKFVVSRGTVGNENQTQPVITFPAGLRCYGIADGIYTETRKITGSKENIYNLDPIEVENGVLKNPVRMKARWRSSNDMRNFFANNCRPTPAKISGTIVEIYFDSDKFNPQIKKASSEKLLSIFTDNKKGSLEVEKCGVSFSFPKHTVLIKTLLKQANIAKDAVIFDFFAGSGTTGHAVLDLNKEDGGHRQFILCTNNELGKEAQKTAKKNGYAAGSAEYEDLGVCHAVTYPRMQNIFPDYPGNNLYYYRVDQDITESTIDDVTLANMASQAVFYIAMKENIFNAEKHKDYQLLYNENTDIIVVTDPDMDIFDVEEEIVSSEFHPADRETKVYCSVYSPCSRYGVEYIPYPKEVLDVLRAAKKYIRREVA